MGIERTQKQIEASRINGAKSRGPVTPMGKRRSSRNALRHGRLASSFVLNLENATEFRESLRELCDEHQPATPTERRLVEAMAIAEWQQYRIMNAAAVAYDLRSETERQHPLRYKHHGAEILSNTVTGVLEDRPVVNTMNVERSRLQRDYIAALNMLQKMQDRRERRGVSPVVELVEPAEESENPELVEPDDCAAAPRTPIGKKDEITFAEIPANSLETNETPQVRFPPLEAVSPFTPASPAEADTAARSTALTLTQDGGTGFSLWPSSTLGYSPQATMIAPVPAATSESPGPPTKLRAA